MFNSVKKFSLNVIIDLQLNLLSKKKTKRIPNIYVFMQEDYSNEVLQKTMKLSLF